MILYATLYALKQSPNKGMTSKGLDKVIRPHIGNAHEGYYQLS